jgi:hypothetical protein
MNEIGHVTDRHQPNMGCTVDRGIVIKQDHGFHELNSSQEEWTSAENGRGCS